MPKYCEECNGEILDVKNLEQTERAILQGLLVTMGVHICPAPTYCRCDEGLEPLELEIKRTK